MFVWLLSYMSAFAQFHGEVGEKLENLPEEIKFQPGQVSLFADYEGAAAGKRYFSGKLHEERPGDSQRPVQVPIFVINDSDQKLSLPHQDGDIYLKQEVHEDGEWIRSQPHISSWCGNSYGMMELPPKHFFLGSALLHSSDDAEPREVRYRFYRRGMEDQDATLFSNVGQARVSSKSIEQAQYDTKAISGADLPKLLDLVSGRVKVQSLDHVDARYHALGQLKKFPGDNKAIAAVEVMLKELATPTAHADDDEARGIEERLRFEALEVYTTIAPAEGAFQVLRKSIDEETIDESQQIHIFFLIANGIEGLEKERQELFERVFGQPENPLFVGAAKAWAGSTLASEEEMLARLKGWSSDQALPDKARRLLHGLYWRKFPNNKFRSRSSRDRDSKTFSVTIENIADETIRFRYRHPLDIIEMRFTDGEGELMPDSGALAKTLAKANDEIIEVALAKGERYTITGLNPWPTVEWPFATPITASLQFLVTIPEFGEVGSGSGSSSWFRFDSQREFEPVSAMLRQPLLSPNSTRSVRRREMLGSGLAPNGD